MGTVQYMAAPLREQLQGYHYTEVTPEEQYCCSYFCERVIDHKLKRQIKI